MVVETKNKTKQTRNATKNKKHNEEKQINQQNKIELFFIQRINRHYAIKLLTQNMQTLTFTSDIQSFNEVIQNKMTSCNFSYLSFGSKWNDYPPSEFGYEASFQMLPNFIKCRSENTKILVVVIDDFNNIEITKNMKILQNTSLDFQSIIEIVVLNKKCQCASDIKEILNVFLCFNEQHSITPEKSMVVNFIKFINPNEQEIHTEFWTQNAIRTCMKTLCDGKFTNCFYQWFGYDAIFHNMIYNDNNFIICYHSFIHSWISRLSNGKPITFYDFYDLMHKIQNLKPNENKKICEYFKHCVDLQSYHLNENCISCPVILYMVQTMS